MKLVVPLTMPVMDVNAEAYGRRAKAPRNGTPAMTLASNRSETPARAAASRQLASVMRQEGLVGGHDRNAAGERVEDQRPRRFEAAEGFDDDRGAGSEHGFGVGRRPHARCGAGAQGIAHERRRDLDARAPRRRSGRGQPRHRGANLAQAEQADTNHRWCAVGRLHAPNVRSSRMARLSCLSSLPRRQAAARADATTDVVIDTRSTHRRE